MKLKIGILGCRGIPNAYGGFEQFAEYLAVGLVNRGHDVFVYNSSLHPYKEEKWNGVNIIHCKDREDKLGTAGQFIYDWNCITDARKRNFDILLQLGYTSNSVWYWRWPERAINIVNMDGMEWKRTKYSKLTRVFLKKAEALAAEQADYLIADAPAIQDHLLKRYDKTSTLIPYGAKVFNSQNVCEIENYQLSPYGYYLAIARMEPENNIETIIRGYLDSAQTDPLVIVGNLNKYGKTLAARYRGEKIKFPGAIYDAAILNNLRFFSRRYFHGHSVGGTNPSLLEAMACRCPVIAHDNSFNRNVLGEDGDYFSHENEIAKVLNLPWNEQIALQRQTNNLRKIETVYNPAKIIDGYERLMFRCIERQSLITNAQLTTELAG